MPGAYSIDETPDQSSLYVGTEIGDVYTIDPQGLKVTRRYIASEIGPYGFEASAALPLADGRVALLATAGGIPSVDGSNSFAVWNPSDNSIQIYTSSRGAFEQRVPVSVVCGPLENIGGFTLAANRSKIVVGSIDSDGTLCEVDAATGQFNYTTGPNEFIFNIFTSPDGSYIALPSPNTVVIFDGQTLNKISQITVAGDTSSAADLVFSADSKTLFVSSPSIVYAYSISTGQQIGWLPNIVVQFTAGGLAVGSISGPVYEFMDGTGILSGPLEEGMGFLDTTMMRGGAIGTQFLNGYLNPATGSVSGGTAVQLADPNSFGLLRAMYFGSQPTTTLSATPSIISATTPAGVPGPAAVYVFANDGGMQLLPDGFSFGPSILEATPNKSSSEGGGVGIIYGYGFGPATATSIPAGLGVTVGGKSATVLGFNPNAYNTQPPPFPLQSVYYTIPPGSSGSSADVGVTSSSGTATSHSALTYLPAAQQFALAGSALAQGIYDPVRDLYYFTDATSVRVFSLAQPRWMSPIAISGAQRLWGIALSPDSSKLAVTDIQAGAVSLIDPTNTSSMATDFLGAQSSGSEQWDPARWYRYRKRRNGLYHCNVNGSRIGHD